MTVRNVCSPKTTLCWCEYDEDNVTVVDMEEDVKKVKKVSRGLPCELFYLLAG